MLLVFGVLLHLNFAHHITWKDWKFLYNGARIKLHVFLEAMNGSTVSDVWTRSLLKFGPQRLAILFCDQAYTMGDIECHSNQTAHFAVHVLNLQAGDVVALFMTNRPEFIYTWLGMSKVGVATSLLNSNLFGESLIHSIRACKAKHIIFGRELAHQIKPLTDFVKKDGILLHCMGGSVDFAESIDTVLSSQPQTPVIEKFSARGRGTQTKDPCLFVYTSGTTGMPKAAPISHYRFILASYAFSTIFRVLPEDRVYCTLPLYHSAAGVVGVGFLFQKGTWAKKKKKKHHFLYLKKKMKWREKKVGYNKKGLMKALFV